MSAVAILDVVVAAFGICMGASTLLQTRRILRSRSAEDVDPGMLVIMLIGSVLWLAYGVAHSLPTVIVANLTWVISVSLTLMVTMRFRNLAAAPESEPAQEDAAAVAEQLVLNMNFRNGNGNGAKPAVSEVSSLTR